MKRFIIAGSLLLLFTAAVGLWPSRPPASTMSVTVSFDGCTNDPAGARFATFRVTNRSEVTVWRWSGCRIEGQPQPLVRSMVSIGPSVCLASGESEVVALLAPTNQRPWRVTLFCAHNDWRRRLYTVTGGSRGLPASWRPAFRCLATSEWIDRCRCSLTEPSNRRRAGLSIKLNLERKIFPLPET